MDKVKKKLFDNIMLQKYRNSLKECLNALRKNKDDALRDLELRRKLHNVIFNKWMKFSKDSLKKYFD